MARRARNNPVNPPPPYEDSSNQQGYHPSAYQDGHDNYESSSLLPQQSSNYGSVPIPPNLKKSHTLSKLLGFFLLVLIIMGIVLFHFYPDKNRSEWEAEQHAHEVMRAVWNSERKAMVEERGTWQKEREDHILERETMAAEREKWRSERAEHDDRERQEREEIAAEREKLRREQEAIAAEREKWRKEQVDHENRQRREEEEKRALIIWQELKASTGCLRYGTREYSATLANVPHYMDPLQECWKKSIDIHGRSIFPSRCETGGVCGTVTGYWDIDFNEASCVTWWRGYDNKGCVEPGIHRYESVLENLQWGDDWHVMCATTPGRVQGRVFDGPSSCASWRSGINGIWLVEDENCR